jgi:tRNA threonylcarbamoyladenosine biosynthesis protein TsaB
MLVLALDTTTRIGSCALARDGVVLSERASDPEKSHAEHLPGDLRDPLETAGVALDAVDAFAVATGPGSFTGLRIGIATMQGLAFAMGKRLVGVSAFDALAVIATPQATLDAHPGFRLAAWIDAWRGEVYAALYQDADEIEEPSVERPEQVLARLNPGTTFIGDGARTFAALIHAHGGIVAENPVPLLAGAIARLAHQEAEAVGIERLPAPHDIRPLYVRRMDAELARDARPRQ